MSGSGSGESSGTYVSNFYATLTPEQKQEMQMLLSQGEAGPSQAAAASPAPSEESSTNPFYDVDPEGNIIANRKGRVVMDRLYSLCQRHFGDRLLKKWSEQSADLKQQIVGTLRDEFPQEVEFDTKEVHKHMSLWIRHRRDTMRRAYRDGLSKPHWCSRTGWTQIKNDERTPDKYKVQKDVADVRMHGVGNHKLGSSGKAGLQASMVSDSELL